MNKPNIRSWDAAEHLKDEADMASYLDAALEDGDAALITAVLDDIARARGEVLGIPRKRRHCWIRYGQMEIRSSEETIP